MGRGIEGTNALAVVRPVDDRMFALLRRCRAALDPGDAGWERDVGTAVEEDAALVADLDALLAE